MRGCTALLVGLLLGTAAAHPARAQAQLDPDGTRPFSRLAFYAGGQTAVKANRFGDAYRSRPGLEAAVTTPFYAGVAGLDVGLRRYAARAGQAAEDFWAAPVALRWGVRPRPLPRRAPRLRAEATTRLGILAMRFASGPPGLRNESELLMGVDAGLSLRLFGAWRLAVGAGYEHVFTDPAVRLAHVRAGVRRSVAAPRWLQTLLR